MGQTMKITTAGLGIWMMSLLWPGINQAVSQEAMIALALGLGTVSLVYAWNRYHTHSTPPTSPQIDHRPPSVNDSRPIKPIGMA